MKKLTISTLLTLLILIPSMIVFSQSLHEPYKQSVCLIDNYKATNSLDGVKSIFSEDFSRCTFPPAGWSVIGDGTDNWSAEATINAGGVAPEVRFYWNPNFEGSSRLASPNIATSGYSTILLRFKHFLDDFGGAGSYTLMVETTSDGGTTWNEVWSVEDPGANIDPEEKFILISNGDVGSDNFQIAFRFNGDSYQLNWWNIDDVVLEETLMLDAEASAINIPYIVPAGDLVTPTAVVTNIGAETITFDANFAFVENGGATVYSEDVTVTDLDPFESQTLTFPEWTSYEGTFDATLTTNLIGDENPENDQLTTGLEALSGVLFLKPLYEEFTSSTCGPCASANETLDPILAANAGTHSLIKYQMNWPGGGDPYYTPEGGVRKNYYEVTYVPDMYINASQLYPGDMTQEIYDSYIGIPTAMEIDVTAEIDDNYNITVTANIDVISGYDAGLTAHIVVVEKLTVANVGTNGETEFYNVMMKMLPNASGTLLPALTPGTTESITETYDMGLTFIEEPNDLAVIVFVQDNSDKSLIQSEQVNVQGSFEYFQVTFNVDDSFGDPVQDASVWLEGKGTLTTNASGQVIFEEVFPGSWDYEVTAEGLFPNSGSVEVVDQDVIMDIVLEVPYFYFYEEFADEIPADWTINETSPDHLYQYDGKVIFFRQSNTNNPIMLVTPAIDISPAGKILFDVGETYGPMGLPDLSFGTVSDPNDPSTFTELQMYTPDVNWETIEYDLSELSNTEEDVYFAWQLINTAFSYFSFDNVILTYATIETFEVTFNVEDETGNALEGAEVILDEVGTLFTDPMGQVTFETVVPGTYNYDVIADGYASYSGNVEVIDQNVVVDVVLEAQSIYFIEEFSTEIPAGWTINVSDPDQIYWYEGFVIFFRQSWTNNTVMLVSPAIDISPAGKILFDVGETYGPLTLPDLSFGTVTDPNDPNTFTELEMYTPGVAWETIEYDLGSLSNTEEDVYFAWQLITSDFSYFSFDNVILTYSSTSAQQVVDLNLGYQFVSSRIEPENPDMLVVLQDILNDNLDFVRNSNGETLRKIGPNWVNGIGDWITTEGFLFKMFGVESLEFNGTELDPLTLIDLQTGFQFVSYLPDQSIDALFAFDGILNENLDYIRNSNGETLRKIGPIWVNGIGDANPGEGYLIKMFADDQLIYNIPNEITKSSTPEKNMDHFMFDGGNAADPVYSIYVSGLNIGDEVAVFDGKKMVGASVIVSENVLKNSVPVFFTLTKEKGFEANNQILLKVWDAEKQIEVSATYTFDNEYTEAYTKTVFPENDGEFSVINITKRSIGFDSKTLSEISIYPNPATNILNIVSSKKIQSVSIFNSIGLAVYTGKDIRIKTNNFESGVYIVKIKTTNGVETQKITIR
jgi:hypothetical protein